MDSIISSRSYLTENISACLLRLAAALIALLRAALRRVSAVQSLLKLQLRFLFVT